MWTCQLKLLQVSLLNNINTCELLIEPWAPTDNMSDAHKRNCQFYLIIYAQAKEVK